jgi:acetolactate synthase-1/2/3 large subunit
MENTELEPAKASDLVVAALENEGVEYVFGLPGEENLDLLESLRTSSIRFVLTRHEQTAGFMAATYGRLTGKVGVCLATLGPGATNLVTAAAYAQLGAMPMLMITGQKPIKRPGQGDFQIVDVVAMMQPLTKFASRIVHGSAIPGLVREAVRRARQERPGAVHLELPEDVAAETVGNPCLFEPTNPRRPTCGDTAISEAVELIEAARRPLLLVGADANRNRIANALEDFVDKTGMPFCNTQMGKGVIQARHGLYVGTAALSSGDFIHCAIDNADLIINVGHDVIEKPPFIMRRDGAKVVHVNFSPATFDEIYFPQLELVGDIANTVQKLTARLGRSAQHDFGVFETVRAEVLQHIAERADDGRIPMVPQRIVADVRAVMPPDSIVALDNGMYKIWFTRNYLTQTPYSLLVDNALASMGAGLPSAMAAAMLHPGKRVLAVCGDGGFMMNSQDLETAVRLGLDLVILVLRDDAYGMIRWKQAADGMADWGLSFGNPDFVAYAASYGATGRRVTQAADLAPFLEAAFDAGGIHLIEVPIDYSENRRVFEEELPKRVGALRQALENRK